MRSFNEELLLKAIHNRGYKQGYRTESENFNKEIIIPWEKARQIPQTYVENDTYPLDKVRKDEQKVADIKSLPSFNLERESQEATGLEYFLCHAIDKLHWFGAGVSAYPSAEYDDMANGIDVIAEFEKIGRFAGFDVTTSEASLEKKLSRYKRRLSEKKMVLAQYVEGEGEVEMPIIILYADKEKVSRIIENADKKDKNKYQNLKIKIEFLDQAIVQLISSLEKIYGSRMKFNKDDIFNDEKLRDFIEASKKIKFEDETKNELANYHRDLLVLFLGERGGHSGFAKNYERKLPYPFLQ